MEEQPKHLTYFKVQNFKGLESLELKDIGQFNLILGDNNVGKTSVLEALLFDVMPYKLLRNLGILFSSKSNIQKFDPALPYFDLFLNTNSENSEINYFFDYIRLKQNTITARKVKANYLHQFEIDNLIKNTLVDLEQLPKDIIVLTINSLEYYYTFNYKLHRIKDDSANYFPFIKAGLTYKDDLVNLFSRTVDSSISLKQEFINDLLFISNDIGDIRIDTHTIPNNPILSVLFKNDKEPLPLFMMGDGVIRLIRMILEIIAFSGSRLMIDEIDNGMHFSKMKKVWEVVLKVAEKYNTQLFITTHNSECLRAFKEVLEEQEMQHLQEKVASYSLFRNKEGKVDNVRYSFEGFEFALDNNIEVRD